MATYLHDVGMSPTTNQLDKLKHRELVSTDFQLNELVRKLHHELSFEFILDNWHTLKIPNKKYAEAIALVCLGHRIQNIFDFDLFKFDFIVKGGTEFVCLPYLCGILRLADELDITNDRTPDLLFKNYYPESKISAQEWEKHKANYFVNFKDLSIIITAECHERIVFYGLIEQKTKIEKTIKEIQKLIRLLPVERKSLSLKYHQIEHNLTPIGFLPINIGFSFDFQNTFKAFIGKNLYNDDFIAIREAVQNSLDTCLYKRSLDSNFKAKIIVELKDRTLSIDDNGFGMDLFIIENFFSKLNSSYYLQEKILQKYDSIGQFGIGVFSYFLMCDYFDVETKTDTNAAIKFRVSNHAELPFYFFSQTSRSTEGTIVTFYLKSTIETEILINKIKHFFLLVDIPIVIKKDGNQVYTNKKPSFEIDKTKIISEKTQILAKVRIPEIDIIECYINNKSFEGQVNLFIIRKKSEIFPEDLYEIILQNSTEGHEIFQKGIFVTSTAPIALQNSFGRINLKQRLELNLSRNYFHDQDIIENVIRLFENTLIENVFKSWKNYPTEAKWDKSNQFVANFLNSHRLNNDVVEILKENWYFKVYFDGIISIKSFAEITKSESFILLNKFKAYDHSDKINNGKIEIKSLFDFFKIPILLVFNDELSDALLNVSSILHYKMLLFETKYNHFFNIFPSVKSEYPMQSIYGSDCVPFNNSKTIVAYPNISVTRFLNSEHPFINYLITNKKEIVKNQALKELVDDLLDLIKDHVFNFHLYGLNYGESKDTLKVIKKNVFHLNKFFDRNFDINKKDFPVWTYSKNL